MRCTFSQQSRSPPTDFGARSHPALLFGRVADVTGAYTIEVQVFRRPS
jgi:hypothetical protein